MNTRRQRSVLESGPSDAITQKAEETAIQNFIEFMERTADWNVAHTMRNGKYITFVYSNERDIHMQAPLSSMYGIITNEFISDLRSDMKALNKRIHNLDVEVFTLAQAQWRLTVRLEDLVREFISAKDSYYHV